MKTLLALAVAVSSIFPTSAQVPPCPGAPTTDADLKWYAAKAAQAHVDAREDARLAAYVEAAKYQATAASKPANDAAYQMLQLRIVSAYPNNPAMWQYLNRNPNPRVTPTMGGRTSV
ncbi:MAG: hypothetical protein WC003_13430 [Terrimicrobiaceae bacterium]